MTHRACAFVFPGQGSQRVGMLEPLLGHPRAGQLLVIAEEASGLPLRSIAEAGPETALADTRAAQPLLYVTGVVWAETLSAAGIAPAVVAGHSLGELAALAVAGVYPVEAGLRLVCARGALMAEAAAATPGTMAAVLGMPRDTVLAVVADMDGVWVANDNSAAQVVITGTHAGIERATGALSEAGARRVVPLAVAGPFHSPLMQPAAEAFAALLEQVDMADAGTPVVQNADPRPATDAAAIKARLAAQIVAPVRWTETVSAFVDAGVTNLVECGTGAVLSGLARKTDGVVALSVETDGVQRIGEVLAS